MRNYVKKAYAILEKTFCGLLYMLLERLPIKLYQPLYGSARQGMTRACEDRWVAIAPRLNDAPGSVLDIGSNMGFFTFMATEKKKMAMGVEANPFNVIACRSIAKFKENERAYFLNGLVTKEFVEAMPSYDIVFNFSVFHHWVKAYGQDVSMEMMRLLAEKCSSLFFETGQSDELGTKWAQKLAFMGDNPDQWIQDFLKECGFAKVEPIGTFETGLTNVKRTVYHAQK